MVEKGLTAKQQAFVMEYLVDLNATQAAIRAGYSSRTAEIIGHENLRKPRIAEAIAVAFQARSERTNITADEVLEMYAKRARADIRDFLEFRTEKTVVDRDDDGQPIIDYRLVVETKDSSEVDGTLINEIAISKDGTFKFKLHDSDNALNKLAQHLGLLDKEGRINIYNTNVQQTTVDNTKVAEARGKLNSLPTDERQRFLAVLAQFDTPGEGDPAL